MDGGVIGFFALKIESVDFLRYESKLGFVSIGRSGLERGLNIGTVLSSNANGKFRASLIF